MVPTCFRHNNQLLLQKEASILVWQSGGESTLHSLSLRNSDAGFYARTSLDNLVQLIGQEQRRSIMFYCSFQPSLSDHKYVQPELERRSPSCSSYSSPCPSSDSDPSVFSPHLYWRHGLPQPWQ
jgi:hypothetical protein